MYMCWEVLKKKKKRRKVSHFLISRKKDLYTNKEENFKEAQVHTQHVDCIYLLNCGLTVSLIKLSNFIAFVRGTQECLITNWTFIHTI